MEANAPGAIPTALRAWRCFVPYREGTHEYAWSTRLVPESCEADVVKLLVEVGCRRGNGRPVTRPRSTPLRTPRPDRSTVGREVPGAMQ